jgi:NAD(P)-dependent dehydrogenase (short-subunit alcohol dehydrogenase family)
MSQHHSTIYQTKELIMFKNDLLKGKRILITGGGSGLGKEIAARYLELGADLYICGRRDSVLRESADELMGRLGGSVKSFAVDIRNAEAVDQMIDEIWKDGPLTGLVNNAAGNFISRTEDLSSRGFDAIANIVLHGTFYVTHSIGKRWIANNLPGSVVSILVTWVMNGGPFVVPSAMSKAGVNVMTKSLAVEWGRHQIRLNAIAPGVFPDRGHEQAPIPGPRRCRPRRGQQSDGPRGTHGRIAESGDLPDGGRLRVADRPDADDRRRKLARDRRQLLSLQGLDRQRLGSRAQCDSRAKREGPAGALGVSNR